MSWTRDDHGAVMVEYAFMVAFVVAVAFIGVQLFGESVLGLFRSAVDVSP
ncbi:MAG TPA: Flp family type IVb pilin [Acidimicrobiia bacterium]|nr:Flp family type IVb pilin [Acidimicrobiia bacterium]